MDLFLAGQAKPSKDNYLFLLMGELNCRDCVSSRFDRHVLIQSQVVFKDVWFVNSHFAYFLS